MEFNLIFALVLVFMLICLFLLSRPSRQDKIEQADLENRLEEDEFIYDPVTGAKMTLEQAENGLVSDPDVFDRIKSDKEIETYYSEEQQEFEYITRDLQRLNLAPTDSDEPFDLFNASQMSKGYQSFNLLDCYELKAGRYLCLIQLMNNYSVGGLISEVQLGACLMRTKTFTKSDFFEDLEIEHFNDSIIVRLPKIAKHSDLNDFISMIIRN